MFHLEVNQLHKSYGDTPVFEGIEFGIRKGELVTLLGPSGCGKSTLLRALAGLTPVDGGQVRVAGEDITWQAPQKRGIGMVFQSYALFPNMTVWDNVAFGLKMKPQPGRDLAASVQEALELVELTGESVEDTVIRQMEIETLQKAMQSLTPVQRERLHFYFFEGMTYRQIAAKEGVGEKNIRESINGAVKKIKKFFD